MERKMSKDCRNMRIWSAIGMILAVYATYVELRVVVSENYVAMCDISPAVSCSSVLNSVYGRGFGLEPYLTPLIGFRLPPNSVIGILYYYFNIKLSYRHELFMVRMQLLFVVVANFLSVYLAYLLYFVLHSMCLVCVATYVVNFMLMLETYKVMQIRLDPEAFAEEERPLVKKKEPKRIRGERAKRKRECGKLYQRTEKKIVYK